MEGIIDIANNRDKCKVISWQVMRADSLEFFGTVGLKKTDRFYRFVEAVSLGVN